jgi:hypothetical protein
MPISRRVQTRSRQKRSCTVPDPKRRIQSCRPARKCRLAGGGNEEAGGVKDVDSIAAGGGEDNGHLGVGDARERAGDGQAGGGVLARSSGRE